MNKLRVIDLLNKIANGEEVPKKIKYNDKIYIAKGNAIENFVDYCSDEDEWCFNHCVRYENLNDEVEIIEDKEIEKLILDDLIDTDEVIYDNFHNIELKINELIDKVNSLENKQ